MKRYLIAITSFAFPLIALANDTHNGGHEEDVSIADQLQDFLPFEHLEHGHWFAVFLSIILWASLIYTIYSLNPKIPPQRINQLWQTQNLSNGSCESRMDVALALMIRWPFGPDLIWDFVGKSG